MESQANFVRRWASGRAILGAICPCAYAAALTTGFHCNSMDSFMQPLGVSIGFRVGKSTLQIARSNKKKTFSEMLVLCDSTQFLESCPLSKLPLKIYTSHLCTYMPLSMAYCTQCQSSPEYHNPCTELKPSNLTIVCLT